MTIYVWNLLVSSIPQAVFCYLVLLLKLQF